MMRVCMALVMLLFGTACASPATNAPAPNDPRAAYLADSTKSASCVTTVESSRNPSSAGGEALVVVRPSYANNERVFGANLSSDKPKLVAQSWGNGIIHLRIPEDSIPASHSISVAIRLIGFRVDRGTLTVFPGDTVNVEARLCPQPMYLQTQIEGSSP